MGVRWGWGRPPLWGRSGVPLFPWDPPMCRPPPPNPVCPPPRSPLTLGGGHCGRPCCHPPHCTGAPPLPHSPPRLGCSSRGGTTAPAPTGSPPAGDTHTVTPWRGAGSHGRYRGDPSGEVPGAGGGLGCGEVSLTARAPRCALWGGRSPSGVGGALGRAQFWGAPPGPPVCCSSFSSTSCCRHWGTCHALEGGVDTDAPRPLPSNTPKDPWHPPATPRPSQRPLGPARTPLGTPKTFLRPLEPPPQRPPGPSWVVPPPKTNPPTCLRRSSSSSCRRFRWSSSSHRARSSCSCDSAQGGTRTPPRVWGGHPGCPGVGNDVSAERQPRCPHLEL